MSILSDNKKIEINLGMPGIVTALTVTFVVLKALDKIDWDWVWVFSPIWITLSFVGGALVATGIIWLVAWWWNWSSR